MKYALNEKVIFYNDAKRLFGEVREYSEDTNTYLLFCSEFIGNIHEKQIRKIKPKKKAREWWISKDNFNEKGELAFNYSGTSHIVSCLYTKVLSCEPAAPENYIHVKEVL